MRASSVLSELLYELVWWLAFRSLSWLGRGSGLPRASVLWWRRTCRPTLSRPADSRKIVDRPIGRTELPACAHGAAGRHLSFNYSLKRRSSPKFSNNYDARRARKRRLAAPGARQIYGHHPPDRGGDGDNGLPWQRLRQQRPRWHKRWLIFIRLTSSIGRLALAALLKYSLYFNSWPSRGYATADGEKVSVNLVNWFNFAIPPRAK